MIHKATQLVKFKKLQRRLGLPKRRDVVGILESLWHLTMREAPRGDIGKLDDETIAIELEWDADPATLIRAMVETRWLDESPCHRLIVHDWSEHAPNFVKGNLTSHKQEFAGCSEQVAIAGCLEQPAQGDTHLTGPNLTKQLPVPVSGVLKSGKKPATAKTVFKNLTSKDLGDDEALQSWYLYATSDAQSPILAPSEMNLLNVFAAAERAIQHGSKPIALFASIVGKQQWELITSEQEERGRKRLANLRRGSNASD